MVCADRSKKMIKSSPYLFMKLLMLLSSIILIQAGFAVAKPLSVQSAPLLQPGRVYTWSLPRQIPGHDDDAPTPFLVADQNKTIHAFNSKLLGRELVIVYSQWTPEGDWTMPVDILLSPREGIARIMGAFLDQYGVVHVIFFGGNEINAGIYYAHAPVAEAGRAPAWSPVQLIGGDAGPVSYAALTGDEQGNLFVIYSGKADGSGLYAIYSFDGGMTWTEPAQVWTSRGEESWPINLRITLDHQGQVHAVWTIVDVRGIGNAVLYSRLAADRSQWSNPVAIGERNEGDYSANWGSIIEYQDQLIVIYQDGNPATRWMRRSLDGGQTWTDPIRPFDYIGEYGASVLLVDNTNTLHMILGLRRSSNPDIHGMYHSLWLGDRWSEPTPVVSGPRVVSRVGGAGFDPTLPHALISQGNLLMVVWKTDAGAGLNGIWYSHATLDTEELPVVPPPTPGARVTFEPLMPVTSNSDAPAPTPPAPSAQVQDFPPPPSIRSPSTTLTAALVPPILLISVVVIFYRLRSNQKR